MKQSNWTLIRILFWEKKRISIPKSARKDESHHLPLGDKRIKWISWFNKGDSFRIESQKLHKPMHLFSNCVFGRGKRQRAPRTRAPSYSCRKIVKRSPLIKILQSTILFEGGFEACSGGVLCIQFQSELKHASAREIDFELHTSSDSAWSYFTGKSHFSTLAFRNERIGPLAIERPWIRCTQNQ